MATNPFSPLPSDVAIFATLGQKSITTNSSNTSVTLYGDWGAGEAGGTSSFNPTTIGNGSDKTVVGSSVFDQAANTYLTIQGSTLPSDQIFTKTSPSGELVISSSVGNSTITYGSINGVPTAPNFPNQWVVTFDETINNIFINDLTLIGNNLQNPTTFIFRVNVANTIFSALTVIGATAGSPVQMIYQNGALPALTYWQVPESVETNNYSFQIQSTNGNVTFIGNVLSEGGIIVDLTNNVTSQGTLISLGFSSPGFPLGNLLFPTNFGVANIYSLDSIAPVTRLPTGNTGASRFAAVGGDTLTGTFAGPGQFPELNVHGVVGCVDNITEGFPPPETNDANAPAAQAEAITTYDQITNLTFDKLIANLTPTLTLDFTVSFTIFPIPDGSQRVQYVVQIIADTLTIGTGFTITGDGVGSTTLIILETVPFTPGGSTSINVPPGSSITLTNGAKPSLLYWYIPTSSTATGITTMTSDSSFAATSFSGSLFTPYNIEFTGDGIMSITGGLFNVASTGSINFSTLSGDSITTIYSQFAAIAAGDPHVICLDGSRLDMYDDGFYRMFSYCTDSETVIINAEIRRHPTAHVDAYHRVWIYASARSQSGIHTRPPITSEYMITFHDTNITVEDIIANKTTTHTKWQQSYTTQDQIHFEFMCETTHNTVGLTTNCTSGAVDYSGAFVGDIISLTSLKSNMTTHTKTIIPAYYAYNSIVVGSSAPHTKMFRGHSQPSQQHASNSNTKEIENGEIFAKAGTFRILQWETDESAGVLNGVFDEKGTIRVLFIKINDMISDVWMWTGDFWNLACTYNFQTVSKYHVFECALPVTTNTSVLLRIQANGSVSAAINGNIRLFDGLMKGRMINLNNFYFDTHIYTDIHNMDCNYLLTLLNMV